MGLELEPQHRFTLQSDSSGLLEKAVRAQMSVGHQTGSSGPCPLPLPDRLKCDSVQRVSFSTQAVSGSQGLGVHGFSSRQRLTSQNQASPRMASLL